METDNTEARYLVLRRQQALYALPAANVEEILSLPDITPLPEQPEYIRGIISYKGHAAAVVSLQAICGCGNGADEKVCVVLCIDDFLIALTAESAESLVADSGERMRADRAIMDGRILALDFVMPGDPAIFVVNLRKTYKKIEDDFNTSVFS